MKDIIQILGTYMLSTVVTVIIGEKIIKGLLDSALELCKVCNLFGYGEIKTSTYTSTIMQKYMDEIKEPNFAMVKISSKEDVWSAFVELLNVEKKIGWKGEWYDLFYR